MELDYKDYYLNAIHKNPTGFKLVLGGTGLGKTHGMREAVVEYLKDEKGGKKKFIYITNRHNLISEQQKKFDDKSINCCYLKSNRDIILDLLKKNELEELIESLGGLVCLSLMKH